MCSSRLVNPVIDSPRRLSHMIHMLGASPIRHKRLFLSLTESIHVVWVLLWSILRAGGGNFFEVTHVLALSFKSIPH